MSWVFSWIEASIISSCFFVSSRAVVDVFSDRISMNLPIDELAQFIYHGTYMATYNWVLPMANWTIARQEETRVLNV